MYSILQYAKKRYPTDTHIFVTNDGDFEHEDVYKTADKNKLNKYLESQIENITSFVKKHGTFSDWFFFLGKKEPFLYKSIKKMNDIKAIYVLDSNMGYLPAGVEKGQVEITCMVQFKFNVIVEVTKYAWPQRLPIGVDKDSEMLKSTFLPMQSEMVDEEIERSVQINGQIIVDNQYNFFDLKLTNIVGF